METEKAKKQKSVKLIVINSALLVLMLVVFIMFANTAISQSESKANDAAEKHLSVCNTAVSAVINNNIRLVEKLGNTLTFSQKDGFIADEAMFTRFSDINDFCRITMSSRNGLVSIPGYGSFDFSNRDGFMAAQNGNSYVSNPESDVFRGGTVVAITAPLRRNGVTYNVLYGIKYVYNFEKEIREVCPEQSGEYYIIDHDGKIIFTSENSRWISGDDLLLEFSKTENITSQNIADMTAAIYEKNDFQLSVYNSGGERYMLSMQPLNANRRWSIVYIQTVTDAAVRQRLVFLSVYCIITVLIIGVLMLLINRKNNLQSQSELQKTVITDPLTGVLNINGFFTVPYMGLQKTKDDILTAVRLDVRDFKLINDKYGFVNGDNVLKQVAKTLSECMQNDGIVARIASDNFVFVKNDDGIKFIQNITEKLKQDLKDNIDDSLGREISFSIGAYRITEENESTVSVMDKCNIALKEAKTRLPDTVVYYSEDIMNVMRENREMEKRMYDAMENGEFKIYIQPKVRVKDRRITGGEVLVRWENPENGLMPPDSFIPLFEKNGFITVLDMHILERVMKRLEIILHSGINPWPVSVNISRVTLNKPDFIERINALINKYQSVKGFVELEITESAFTGDYRRMTEMLEKLRNMGMIIVMDDFGSGYSSLNLLKDVPFDVLKLDKLFFDEGSTSERAATIIRSVVQMAKNINVQVVCEGVETDEQFALLEKIGCDVAQGFYFARPMPSLKYEILQENELAAIQR